MSNLQNPAVTIILCIFLTQTLAISQSPQPAWIYYANAPMLSSLTFVDFNGDSIKELIATTYGRGPNPYDTGIVFVWDMNGDSLTGWPIEVGNGTIPGTPAIGDIDGDGTKELVVGNWSQLFVWRADGTSYPGWPRSYGTANSAVLEDLDDDGELEIIYTSGANLYVFKHDGTILSGFPVSVPHDDVGSPSVADIDGDGFYEIVAGINRGPVTPGPFELYAWNNNGSVVPGFPVMVCGIVKSTPALGDLNNDSKIEIVINAYHSSNYDSLYVFDGAGNLRPGWPRCVPGSRLSAPALADLDRDNDLEIIVGGSIWWSNPSSSQIYIFHHDGTSFQNWPVSFNYAGINSGPVIADLDGDTNQLEILIKGQNNIFAYHADGSVVSGFPYFLSDNSYSGTTSPTPVIGDADNDGNVEFAFASCFGEIHFFDEPARYDLKFEEWPMYKHDPRNTGFYYKSAGGAVNEKQLSGVLNINALKLTVIPNPFREKTRIAYCVDRNTKDVELKIFNAAGRLVKDFPRSTIYDLRSTSIVWNGTDGSGRKLPSGVYFVQLAGDKFSITKNLIILK